MYLRSQLRKASQNPMAPGSLLLSPDPERERERERGGRPGSGGGEEGGGDRAGAGDGVNSERTRRGSIRWWPSCHRPRLLYLEGGGRRGVDGAGDEGVTGRGGRGEDAAAASEPAAAMRRGGGERGGGPGVLLASGPPIIRPRVAAGDRAASHECRSVPVSAPLANGIPTGGWTRLWVGW